jgi:hypothetical protein
VPSASRETTPKGPGVALVTAGGFRPARVVLGADHRLLILDPRHRCHAVVVSGLRISGRWAGGLVALDLPDRPGRYRFACANDPRVAATVVIG